MTDHLRAHDAALARLQALHPKLIDLSLDRMRRLCAALGDPQDRMPPVIHVAGTNGKGSTVAYLRAMAEAAGALTIDSGMDVMEELKALTGGRGPDASIDAVGMEAHGSAYDQVKQTLKMETDRPFALRQAMRCTRKAGVVSVPGVYGGFLDKIPFGAAMNKDSLIGDAQLAIHALPGQSRTIYIYVDDKHPLIDAAWMLGNTNDGFSGFTGVDAFHLSETMTFDVRGYDAGSEKNNEKKGFLGALGGGNDRDPENGLIAYHTGIRGDADAPIAWNWDVSKPVAHITITPIASVL